MPVFLPFFGEKAVFGVEENRGVAIFLPFFGEKAVFGVEENKGVAIFLPFFDKNVIFLVEENAGVPVFLYVTRQMHDVECRNQQIFDLPGSADKAKRSRPAADDWIQAEGPPPSLATAKPRPRQIQPPPQRDRRAKLCFCLRPVGLFDREFFPFYTEISTSWVSADGLPLHVNDSP